MRNSRTLLISLTALLLLASAFQSRKLMQFRAGEESVELKDAPPIVVFTSVVLGGFKGILADVLWLRASLLQDEGRYLELVQLADWITKLEPGISEVWSFHAWNMAYNVSVMMPKPEDRWRWVLNGISLLRDEGVVYNRNDPKIYFELAWIFQHKLGENIDAMHRFYKVKWASIMSEFTDSEGAVNYDALTEEQTTKLYDELKLDAGLMSELDSRYGPIDWRLPEANAMYWGYQGVKAAGERGYISCDRAVYQSAMQMFRRGRLQFDEERGVYQVSFNPDMLEAALRAFEDTIARHPNNMTVTDSYALFLREALRRLHDHGFESRARELFSKLGSDEYGGEDTEQGYEAFLKTKPEDAPQFRR